MTEKFDYTREDRIMRSGDSFHAQIEHPPQKIGGVQFLGVDVNLSTAVPFQVHVDANGGKAVLSGSFFLDSSKVLGDILCKINVLPVLRTSLRAITLDPPNSRVHDIILDLDGSLIVGSPIDVIGININVGFGSASFYPSKIIKGALL